MNYTFNKKVLQLKVNENTHTQLIKLNVKQNIYFWNLNFILPQLHLRECI